MKKNVLRSVAVSVALLLSLSSARAEDVKTCLVVYGQDDAKVTYALDSKPVLSYDADALVVTATDVEARHPLSDIARMTFEDVDMANAIHDAAATNRLICATREGVEIYGFAAGSAVRIYDASGRAVRTARVGSDGSLSLSFAGQAAGVYIVKVENEKLKLRISK